MSEIRNSDVPHLIEEQDNGQVPARVDTIESTHLSAAASITNAGRTAKLSMAGTEIKGHLFESKLLTLFMVRALNLGYQFELSANNEDIGGKFDDIIFRYEVEDDTPKGKHWRYRFLQAKHKVDKTALQIKASHLLSANDKVTDYSLVKYFKSYCKIKARGDDIHDCIICTNIDFDYKNMDGIQLKPVDKSQEKILKFQVKTGSDNKKSPTLYKLELSGNERTKLLESDDIRILTNLLSTCATKSQSPNHDIFKTYHVALVEENVIDLSADSTKSKTMKLHKDFIDGVETLSTGARDLRRMLSNLGYEQDLPNWKFQRPGFFEKIASAKKNDTKLPSSISYDDVKDFCDKLVFVVNSPSEDELDAIIQADISQYYDQKDVKSQFLRISNEILDWFKSIKDEKSQWLSSNNGGKILLDSITQQSMDYRKQLMEQLGFHQNVIENIATELKRILDSSTDKVVKFSTLAPRWTAAKMISAIETWPEYKTSGEDSYWVMSTNCLLNKDNTQIWENRLKLTKNSHYLLLVVDNDKSFDFEHLFGNYPMLKNKVIVIDREGENIDEIKFRDLNEKSRSLILSSTISFQGSSEIISDLIHPSETDQVLNFSSIQELMDNIQPIIVPSFGNYNTGNSIYIERKITAFDNYLLNEFTEFDKECKIDSKGKIQWLIQGEKGEKREKRQKEIMGKINGILQGNETAIPADELLDTSSERIIVTGAAGSGKSTILSHYYEEIKKNKPDWWVIKLNLMDQSNALSKMTINSDSAIIDFLVNLPVVGVNQSSFSQSLLRFRLTTGERIVLMLDGYDEIDDHCQQIVIKFMKKLNQKVHIFITTRPNKVENLQIKLSQLSYSSLVKFDRQDQIDYLTSIWIHDLNLVCKTNDDNLSIEKINQFSSMTIDKITNSLKDQQQDFLGIPLQCRILAECFQPKIKSIINQPAITANSETTQYEIENFLKGQSFDLASLYKLLMRTKRQVFLQEKMKLDTNNHIVDYSIKMTIAKIESHLTKLAIETIVHERDHVDILWSANEIQYQSANDKQEENQQLDEFGISFGLLMKHKEEGKPSQVQFLHRTYAEYLVADYIYKGFLLGEKEHNKLLENERVRKWIAREILETKNNVGEFLDSMFKEMVDYSSEEERINKIKHKSEINLPNHLQQFVSSFIDKSPFFNLAYNLHSNTINFMLDCLDATLLPFQIRKIVFRDVHNDFPQHSPYNQQSQVFQRLLAYYDDASDEEWRHMFSRLCIVFQSKRWYRNEVCWDREGPQENVKIFLNYLTKHSKRFKGWESEIEQELSSRSGLTNLAGFIIHNKYRKNFVPQLFEFLSLNFHQDSHMFMVKLLLSALNVYYHASKRESGKITETLTLIQQLGFNQQEITNISLLVLKFEPETFKEFFKLRRPEEETDDSISNWLLKKDSWGMDRLTRAMFYEDRQAIEKFIKRFPFKPTVLPKNLISETNTENCRLLKVAFRFCSDKKFPQKILQSLEKFSPHDQLFWSLYEILSHSIRFKMEEMFELILKSVKEIFDLDFLIRLLKQKMEYPQLNVLHDSIFVVASDIGWFKIIIKSLIQNETNGYKKLNDLIFRDTEIISIPALLSYAEPDTRKKIISAKNIAGWVLLNFRRSFIEIESVYDMLSSKHLLDALNQDQQLQLLDILIKVVPKYLISFMWKSNGDFTVMDFMKRVATIFPEDNVKRLLFYNDGNEAVFFRAMMRFDKMKVDEMLTSLSPKIQEEFNQELVTQAPRLIQDVFFKRHQLEKVIDNGKTGWLNSLLFYLNYGTEKQTADFIHVLTNVRSILKNEERSIWDHILKEKPHLSDVKTFSKRLSNQLGENAVQHLILKDNVMNPILKVNELSEIEQYYDHLPKLKRNEILHRILATPGVIDKMLSDKPLDYWAKHYFIIDSKGISTNVLDGFSLIFYFLEKLNEEQLTKYVDLLVSVVNINGVRYSIWSDYVDKACQTNCNELTSSTVIRQFLKLVVEKKGETCMENLVIHHNCNQQIILRAASSGNIDIFEALLSQCTNQQQNKIRTTFLCRIMIIESLWNRCGPDNLVRVYIENKTSTETANGFGVLILYFLDRFSHNQLGNLIELILSKNKFNLLEGCSVWGHYVNTVFSKGSTDTSSFLDPYSPFCIVPDSLFPISAETLHKFLNRVSFLLGDEVVNKLILHEDVKNCIRQKCSDVDRPAKIMAAMLSHVSFENREGVRMELELELLRPNTSIQNFPTQRNIF